MKAEGRADPPALRNRVKLLPHLQFYWTAFEALGTERALGYGAVGPIPYRAVARFADDHGIDEPDERERFRAIIAAMDGVVLSYWAEERRRAEQRTK